MHTLLLRQIREYLNGSPPSELTQFLEAIDKAYRSFDTQRELLERTLETSNSELVERNQALQESEARFRHLVDMIPDIIAVHQEGKIVYINARGAQLLGGASQEALIGARVLDFVHPDFRTTAAQRISLIREGAAAVPLIAEKFIRLDGHIFDVEVAAIETEFKGRPAVQVIARDISQRKTAEADRSAYLETLALLEEVIVEMDMDHALRRVSDSWEKLMMGVSAGDPVGRKIDEWVHADYRYYLLQDLSNLTTGKKTRVVVRFPVPVPYSSSRWIEGKFMPMQQDGGIISGIRGVLRDVTLDHLSEKQINFYAYHDHFTGLPNRARMEEELYRALLRAERDRRRLALGFIDLDNFNQINDYLGHRIGDRVILSVAERLRTLLGGGDKLFRWGGDQFVVILPDLADLESVRQVGRRLLEAVTTPIDVDGESVHTTFSVGFAAYPDDGLTAEDLLGQADRAMIYAKSQGRFQVQFSWELPERSYHKEQVQVRNHLLAAVTKKEILPFFQPIVEAATGRVVGFEALARWPSYKGRHPVGPDTFIPIAENMGIISQLGESVFTQALEMLIEAAVQGQMLRAAINISRRQLFASDFVDRLVRLSREHDVDPSQITLEITESIAMLDVDFSFDRLKALDHAGFSLSIDDFGTGYSSLSQLHEMPVHEVKVDMTFVRRIHTAEGFRVVQAIANIGRALNLSMVAEGVEDRETGQQLTELGIQYLQGNFFSKPLPGPEFLEYLKSANL